MEPQGGEVGLEGHTDPPPQKKIMFLSKTCELALLSFSLALCDIYLSQNIIKLWLMLGQSLRVTSLKWYLPICTVRIKCYDNKMVKLPGCPSVAHVAGQQKEKKMIDFIKFFTKFYLSLLRGICQCLVFLNQSLSNFIHFCISGTYRS